MVAGEVGAPGFRPRRGGVRGFKPWIAVLPVGIALWSLLPGTLSGQVVQGQVLDEATNAPVAGATVELLSTGGDLQRTVAADEDGRFTIQAPTAGTFRLRAGRIGYHSVTTSAFDLVRTGDALEVEVRLGTEAIVLAPLVVTSDRPARVEHLRLHTRGFFEREERWGAGGMGFGRFLGPADIQRMILFNASDAVRDLRGVRVAGAGGRARQITGRGGCIPPLFVDGAYIRTGGLDDVVSAGDIMAIEVYLGSTVPDEFIRGPRGTPCGAIVVWTGPR